MTTESQKLIEEFENRKYQPSGELDSSERADELPKRNVIYRAVDRMSEFSFKHPTATNAIKLGVLVATTALGTYAGDRLIGGITIHHPGANIQTDTLKLWRAAYDTYQPIGAAIGGATGFLSSWFGFPLADIISERVSKKREISDLNE